MNYSTCTRREKRAIAHLETLPRKGRAADDCDGARDCAQEARIMPVQVERTGNPQAILDAHHR